MSKEVAILTVEGCIKESQLNLKAMKEKLELFEQSIPRLEDKIARDIKHLEELKNVS